MFVGVSVINKKNVVHLRIMHVYPPIHDLYNLVVNVSGEARANPT